MCGRLALTEMPWTYISDLWLESTELDAHDMPMMKGAVMEALAQERTDWQPRYNIAPTQDVMIVRSGRGLGLVGDPRDNYQLDHVRWGMIPSWAQRRNVGQRLFNARAETLLDRPAFRRPLRKQRCVVVASGFYEWERIGKQRHPFLFTHNSAPIFFMAGLWDRWVSKEDEIIESCTIITTSANKVISPIHERMPSVLSLDEARAWLDPSTSLDDLTALAMHTLPEELMGKQAVSSLVNDVQHDDAQCQKPAQIDMIQQLHRQQRKRMEDQSIQSRLPFLNTGS